MRTIRCIYVNCFYRLRFLAEFREKLQNLHFFLGNLRTIALGEKMETTKMTLFFQGNFSALTIFNIHFVFEKSQNSFSCGLPFSSFWCVKYPNFRQKLPVQTAHHNFLESTQPEVTKNPYYVS